MKKIVLIAGTVIFLAACGPTDSPTNASDASTQSKELHRSEKAVAADYATTVQQLYVAYFGRPADPAGLSNFENALVSIGAPTDIQGIATAYSSNAALKTLVDTFGASKESQNLYGSGTASAFVTAVFQNVFGRAPQTAGLDYWSNAISSGTLSQGNAALSIMAGAYANTTAQGLLDVQLIKNRLAAAAYFTTQMNAQNSPRAYAGASAAASARTVLRGVSATTSSGVYQTAIDAAIAALVSGNVDVPLVSSPVTFDGLYLDGVVVDKAGNLYVSSAEKRKIFKVTPAGTISTFAGNGTVGSVNGPGNGGASFTTPEGIAIDASGNIYIADEIASLIRKIAPDGTVSTFAGNGQLGATNGAASAASFHFPKGVAVDSAGNVYVADTGNNCIRKITASGVVSTLAGSVVAGNIDATGGSAFFNAPQGVAVDSAGNVFVADTGNFNIRKITPTGVVTTVAGTGQPGSANGAGTAASFGSTVQGGPEGLVVDSAENIYVTDIGNYLIRKITPAGIVSTLAGSGDVNWANGSGNVASFFYPQSIALDAGGNLYSTGVGDPHVRKIAMYSVKITDDVVGTGTRVANGSAVTVNYTSWLYDANAANFKGTQVNTSIGASPVQFTLGKGQVLPGNDYGIVGMKVGGTRTIIMPGDLAYGAAGSGAGLVPPNATMVFTMTLVSAK